MAALIGQRLNERYTVIEQIGDGGTGIVYLAQDELLQRSVAVKTLKFNHGDTQTFLQEMRTLARLEHPHILPVYDTGVHNPDEQTLLLYMVARRAEGGSLADQLRNGKLTDARIKDIFAQLCAALAYIHSKGVLHLDIKPANILFDANQNVLLSDFGIARLLSQTSNDTKALTGVGTPAYMPPEQFFGGQVGPYSDVYALGAMLHQLLTGEPPVRGFQSNAIGVELKGDVPVPYRDLIKTALQVDPQKRYPTIDNFQQALNDLPLPEPPRAHLVPKNEVEANQEDRRLDAAMPAETTINRPTEVWVQVCLPESDGFRSQLPIKTGSKEEITQRDVRDSTFPIAYERDEAGQLTPARIRIQIEAPDFELNENSQDVILFSRRDSGRVIFTLTPHRDRKSSIVKITVLQVSVDGTTITLGMVTLRTVIHPAGAKRVIEMAAKVAWMMVSVPLLSIGQRSADVEEDEDLFTSLEVDFEFDNDQSDRLSASDEPEPEAAFASFSDEDDQPAEAVVANDGAPDWLSASAPIEADARKETGPPTVNYRLWGMTKNQLALVGFMFLLNVIVVLLVVLLLSGRISF